jgi:restriction system protein
MPSCRNSADARSSENLHWRPQRLARVPSRVAIDQDLFGTLQNEGASKGILVTTSGYGPASYEFASGKPIELIDGSNLLYLLAEHADLKARIDQRELE